MAIKKVLQDRRYKNRELQLMRLMDHPNVVCLKHCFFSTTTKDELFLNLVMEYVPETMYRVLKHYSNANQRMPLIYVKLYTYQVWNSLSSSSLFSIFFIVSEPKLKMLIRYLGGWLTFMLFLGFATGMWNLKIFWYVLLYLLFLDWIGVSYFELVSCFSSGWSSYPPG